MANTSNMSSEAARRKAMGLSPSTYRRESGKVTENDIREYLAETRAMASKRMSADELEDYMYEIEKKTRAENPITKTKPKKKTNRKKLPTKPKIDIGDSVVVLDKNENLNTVVPPEAKPQGNVSGETKNQERQSLKGLSKAGALGLGSSVFNKMFPTLGKSLDVLKNRLEKQEKNTADNNVGNRSYSQQVERSSVFLTTISENLNKSNDLLQQILVAVNARNTNGSNNNTGSGFPNIDIDLPDRNGGNNRRAQSVPNTSSATQSSKPRITGGKIAAIGAGAAAVGAAGYMAYNAITGGNRNNTEPADAQPAAPTPAATVNPAEAARAREETLNATAQRYQASVEERARVDRERAALEERYGQTDTERTVRPEPGSNVRFSPYKAAAYSDPEAQRQHLELIQRERQAERQQNESFRSAARNMASTRPGGLLGEDASVTPEMIQALTTRYGYTSEQLQRYGGGATQENFVRVGGNFYSNAIRRLFDDELKKDLERRAAAAQQPATQNKDASDGSGSGEETDGSGGDATPVQTAAVTPTQNVTPAAAPGTEYDITTGMPIGAPAAAVAPAATREQSSTELTVRQKRFVDRFLRSNQLQDDDEIRSIAENIVKQRNMPSPAPESFESDALRTLVQQEQLRRAGLDRGTFIANKLVIPGRPLTNIQMSMIEIAGVERYPQFVIDQYNRQKNGNATPAQASTATDGAAVAQSSTNEAASNTQPSPAPASRPGVRMGREIGESSRVATPAAPPPGPVTQQTATPESAGVVNPMTDPSGFNARILNVRAQEILFKADKFEYSEGFQLAAASPAPAPAAGGEGPSSAGGSTPGPSPAGGSAQGSASAAPAAAGAPGVTQIGSANITGLDFAAGVDQRINPGIADKTKEIQSAFGKKLTVTSGFRDPARNARVGGAGGSKHLTADAVDVQFPGNQQETIDLIKVASEKGAGGIGVYRPGFLHIDTGAKRVWGPDYKATSIPDWAKPALDEHMGKTSSQAAGGGGNAAAGGESASPMPGAQQAATPTATPVASAPSAPAATPEPASPSSGAAVSRASVADETASRPEPAAPPAPTDATATVSVTPPGPSLPGIDPNNPGPVEPPDAGIRYSRLFNIAA